MSKAFVKDDVEQPDDAPAAARVVGDLKVRLEKIALAAIARDYDLPVRELRTRGLRWVASPEDAVAVVTVVTADGTQRWDEMVDLALDEDADDLDD